MRLRQSDADLRRDCLRRGASIDGAMRLSLSSEPRRQNASLLLGASMASRHRWRALGGDATSTTSPPLTPSTRRAGRRFKPAHAAARDVAPDDGVEAHRLLQEALLPQHEVDAVREARPGLGLLLAEGRCWV